MLHLPLAVRHRDLLAHQDLLARGVILERHTHQMNLYGAVIVLALCFCRSTVEIVVTGDHPPGREEMQPSQAMQTTPLRPLSRLHPNSCKLL